MRPGLAQLPLRLAGAIVLSIGLAHLALPTLGYRQTELGDLRPEVHHHFVDLGAYAIAAFLISFGLFSLLLTFRRPSVESVVFTGLMTVVWAYRSILELIFPTELGLFFVDSPHILLVAALGLLAGLYGLATTQGLRRLADV